MPLPKRSKISAIQKPERLNPNTWQSVLGAAPVPEMIRTKTVHSRMLGQDVRSLISRVPYMGFSVVGYDLDSMSRLHHL